MILRLDRVPSALAARTRAERLVRSAAPSNPRPPDAVTAA
jgi:hypothetical protein